MKDKQIEQTLFLIEKMFVVLFILKHVKLECGLTFSFFSIVHCMQYFFLLKDKKIISFSLLFYLRQIGEGIDFRTLLFDIHTQLFCFLMFKVYNFF